MRALPFFAGVSLLALTTAVSCSSQDDGTSSGASGRGGEGNRAGAPGGNATTGVEGDGDASPNTPSPITPPPNTPPHCQSSIALTEEGEALRFALRAVDQDGEVPAIELVSSPSHGSLSGSLPLLTYTPDPDFSGVDTLRFVATDEAGAACEEAAVTILVSPRPGEDLQLPGRLQASVTIEEEKVRRDEEGRVLVRGTNWFRDKFEIEYEVDLQRVNLRSPGFQLWTYDEDRAEPRRRETEIPEPRTYHGRVVDHPELIATGVVDEGGTLYVSIWNGRHRVGRGEVNVSEKQLTGTAGLATRVTPEITLDRPIPDVSDNELYLPQPGQDFHGFLARTQVQFHFSEWSDMGTGSLIDAVAQIESMLNEANVYVGQKTGVRYDLSISFIETNGSESGDVDTLTQTVTYPEGIDPVSFRLTIADSRTAASHCVAGSTHANPQRIRCIAGFWSQYGWTHEFGHVFRLAHWDGAVDSMYHVMDGRLRGSELTMAQSRRALTRLQSDTIYVPAQAFALPMPPAAYFDYVTVRRNQPVDFDPLENDYDANGDVLAIADFTQPEYGSVERFGTQLRYTPQADFFGADFFTYTATDGDLVTEQTVHVMVVPEDLGGHWPIRGDAGALVDVTGLNANSSQDLSLVVEDGSFADSVTTGPDGKQNAFSSPARATTDFGGFDIDLEEPAPFDFKGDPLGNWILPHVYDPGGSSFSASIWFKYGNIAGDVIQGEELSPIVFGKGTAGRYEKNGKARGPKTITLGGWEIRAQGDDLIFEVGFRSRRAAEARFRVVHEDAVQDGQWHHAVLVIDREANELRGYLDGTAKSIALPANGGPIVASMTKHGGSGAQYSGDASPLLVGGHTKGPAGGSAFSDPRLYYRVLTSDEIATLAQP